MEGLREFEGESLDDALRAASEALGVAVDELHYEMLEEGRRGVFGLGARQVRIRVEAQAEEDEPRIEEIALPPEPPRLQTEQRERKPKPRSKGDGRRSRNRRRERPARKKEEPEEETRPEVEAARGSIEETLHRMVELVGLELDVRTKSGGTNVRVQLGGTDRKLLLQKDAQLLGAFNFLLNRMARRAWPDVGRIQVQCDGHRQRRDEDLVELVREVASQVQQTGKSKELHPMNPYERRLAHITVREMPGLASHSRGDGFLKKIVVTKGD